VLRTSVDPLVDLVGDRVDRCDDEPRDHEHSQNEYDNAFDEQETGGEPLGRCPVDTDVRVEHAEIASGDDEHDDVNRHESQDQGGDEGRFALAPGAKKTGHGMPFGLEDVSWD
jgi:hypothetical protein